MALVLNGSGITSANIADGTITTDDILASDVSSLKSGRKNLIINGGFDVWQRGTSHTTNGYGSADRWYWHQSSASGTMSQQAFSYGQTDVSGNPKYYTRLAVTAGNNNNQLHQRLEDVSSLEAGTYTLSFWAKGTNPGGGTCEGFIWFDFGSGGSAGFYVGTNPTYTVTSSWQKFSLTFTIPDLSSYTKGTNSYATIGVFNQPNGDTSTSAYTIDFANVQFEKGDTATDFEHRSYGEELALCQRYYALNPTGAGRSVTTTNVGIAFAHTVEMRASPTVALVNGTSAVADIGVSWRTISALGGIDFQDARSTLMFLTVATTTNLVTHTIRPSVLSLDAEL